MYGTLIEDREMDGQSKREPSEIHPVFKYLEGKGI